MKKRTIGQVLKLSRVNLHLSLQDVSNKTAIEIPYIEALENDEFWSITESLLRSDLS